MNINKAEGDDVVTTGDENQQELDLADGEGVNDGNDEGGDGEGGDGEGGDGEGGEGEVLDTLEVTIEGVTPTPEEEDLSKAPAWVKDLRRKHRDVQRKLREAEEELKKVRGGGTETKPVKLGPKPTLEGCEYDESRYEQELDAWHAEKRKVEAQQEAEKAAQEEAQKAWQKQLDFYATSKKNLKVSDFDVAEDEVKDSMSVMQQGIILQGAKDPALIVYALGKNPKKLKELSSITDPVKFAFAVAELQGNLKVNRKPETSPERVISNGRVTSGSVDSQLERLRAEAEKTGDFSKVVAYKRQLKAQKKK